MLSETDVARDIYIVEKATPSKRSKVPKELAFEEIIKNNTLPPCSFNEFMDYLVCEESNAELLQFFTWFCQYVERWSDLPPHKKEPSPPWKHSEPVEKNRSHLHAHRQAGSDRLNQILDILDRRNASGKTSRAQEEVHIKSSSPETRNFSTPRRLSGTQTSQLQIAKSDRLRKQATAVEQTAKHLAHQPFRDEIEKISAHYIQDDAPRKLKIPHDDLRECLDAVRMTTHPSALLRAFTAAETILKSRFHSEFVRKSQRNACSARLILIQVIGMLVFLLGLAMDAVFILSSLSRFLRLVSFVLWWPGLVLFMAAAQGICVFLYARNLRQLRPWEQVQYSGRSSRMDDDELSEYGDEKGWSKSRGAPSRAAAVIDPLRKGSMQTFGEANHWEREARMEPYCDGSKSLVYKIWEETVQTQNQTIRRLQHRIVLLSICWASVISTVLAVGLLFVPEVPLSF